MRKIFYKSHFIDGCSYKVYMVNNKFKVYMIDRFMCDIYIGGYNNPREAKRRIYSMQECIDNYKSYLNNNKVNVVYKL